MSLRLFHRLVLGNTRRHSIVSISRNFYSVAGFGKLEVLDQFDAIAKFYKKSLLDGNGVRTGIISKASLFLPNKPLRQSTDCLSGDCVYFYVVRRCYFHCGGRNINNLWSADQIKKNCRKLLDAREGLGRFALENSSDSLCRSTFLLRSGTTLGIK
jgi:hypothetical protein